MYIYTGHSVHSFGCETFTKGYTQVSSMWNLLQLCYVGKKAFHWVQVLQ